MGRVKNLDEIKTMIRERVGKRNTFRHAKREDVESVLSQPDEQRSGALGAENGRASPNPTKKTAPSSNKRASSRKRVKPTCRPTLTTPPAATRHPTRRERWHASARVSKCTRRPVSTSSRQLERIEVPFGDKTIPIYVRVPQDGQKHAIVINFGGIDSFKAESYEYDEGLQKAGMASCAVDMPGVGECPIKASPAADAVFTAVIDYLRNRPDVDAKRIAIMGRSFGGYWAAKMAYVEAKRLRAAVVWGGGVHYFFQDDWLRESTNADSYLMDHDIARCRLFGVD